MKSPELIHNKIVVIDTVDEEGILNIFDDQVILLSAEIFYLRNETEGIAVKQS